MADYRAEFDAEVTFLNGGGLQAQGFRLDIPGPDVSEPELAAAFVRQLGLLMTDQVRLNAVRILQEPHKGLRGRPEPATTGRRGRMVELSHVVTAGMVTYPGLPGPEITQHLTREESRAHYAPGTEFEIGRISMVGNTGTCLDSPYHRYPEGADLAGLPLDALADLPAVVVRVTGSGSRGIGVGALAALDVAGCAALLHTGWDRFFGTPAYSDPAPYLTVEGARWLADHGRSHPAAAEQLGPPGPDQGGDGPGVLGGLGVQELDAAGQGAQAGRGGGGLGVPVGVVAQPPAGGDQLGGGHVPQATAEGFWGGGDQRVELSLGVAGGLDRGAAGRQPYLERCSVPCGTRLSELVAAQGLAGGSGGVQRVGLGAVAAGGPLGPVQLHNLLMVGMQEPGQPGAVATGALDRPHTMAWLLGGQGQQLLVAGRRGRHCRLVDHRTGGRGHDGDGVGVLVGVDPDDDIDEVCQHGIALTPELGGRRDGSVRAGGTAGR